MDLQQGFIVTRHWRDTPAGTQVEFWLATKHGPRQIHLQLQPSVAFIPVQQCFQADEHKAAHCRTDSQVLTACRIEKTRPSPLMKFGLSACAHAAMQKMTPIYRH